MTHPETPGPAPESDSTTDGPHGPPVDASAVSADDARAPGDPVTAPSLDAAVEAILLVVDEPVSDITLAQVLERPTADVREVLERLSDDYTSSGRGFDLREVAGGWRLYTRSSCAGVVERFVLDGQQARLTQAALETLAVVAYKQPVSRARIAAVRGVNVDGVVRTLISRGLIEEAGTEHESGAILYRTSSFFLERMGLTGVDQLPPLAPWLPDIELVEADLDSSST